MMEEDMPDNLSEKQVIILGALLHDVDGYGRDDSEGATEGFVDYLFNNYKKGVNLVLCPRNFGNCKNYGN